GTAPGRKAKTVPEEIPGVSGDARDQAAAMFGVNSRYVSDACRLRAESPELFEKVRDGELTLTRAMRQLGKPTDAAGSPREIAAAGQPADDAAGVDDQPLAERERVRPDEGDHRCADGDGGPRAAGDVGEADAGHGAGDGGGGGQGGGAVAEVLGTAPQGDR